MRVGCLVPPHRKTHFGCVGSGKAHPAPLDTARMRFSVRHGLQNASFRRMRFSSPGQTSSRLTQKRILPRRPHGKAHSAQMTSRKTAFCADDLTQNRILRRRPHAKAHSAPAPSRKSALCPNDLTQNRILCRRSHAKAHSAQMASRETALCPGALTEKRILAVLKTPECAFP